MQQIVRINTQASDFDFASLTAKAQPAVLTGWVEHWPALKASRQGPGALAQYLRPLDNNNEMDTLLLAADTQGKVGYAGTDLQQFNFVVKAIKKHPQNVLGKCIGTQRLERRAEGRGEGESEPGVDSGLTGRRLRVHGETG